MNEAGDMPGRWAPDPIGRHEFRWRDRSGWTGWVSDGSQPTFDPIASPPSQHRSTRFRNRSHAVHRLIIGIVAMLFGVAVIVVVAVLSTPPLVLVVASPIIWGGIEAAMAVRFLLTTAQPSTVPMTEPPPAVDFEDEVYVLDELVRENKISAEVRDLSLIKLRRKYQRTVSGDRAPATSDDAAGA
jgi:hypothetical protein